MEHSEETFIPDELLHLMPILHCKQKWLNPVITHWHAHHDFEQVFILFAGLEDMWPTRWTGLFHYSRVHILNGPTSHTLASFRGAVKLYIWLVFKTIHLTRVKMKVLCLRRGGDSNGKLISIIRGF